MKTFKLFFILLITLNIIIIQVNGLQILKDGFYDTVCNEGACNPFESNWNEADNLFLIQMSNSERYASCVFSAPKLKFNSDVAEPWLTGPASDGFSLGDIDAYQSSTTHLSVEYNCKKEGTFDLSLIIDNIIYESEDGISVSKPETIIMKWKKICSTNRERNRSGFTIKHNNRTIVQNGLVESQWSSTPALISIGSEEHSSEFDVELSNGGSQEFRVVRTLVSSDVVDVEVHGEAKFGSIVRSGSLQVFTLIYKCYKSGSAEIEMDVNVGLFGDLKLRWIKVCDYSEPKVNTVCVGTKPEIVNDVIRDGSTQDKWSINSTATHVIGESESSVIFYLSSSNGAPLHLLRPKIAIEPRQSTFVSSTGTLGDGGALTDAIETIKLNFRCEKRVESKVVVTLQTQSHHLMQFSFTKKCVRRVTRKDKVWTANQALVLLLSAFVFFFAVVWFMFKFVTRSKPRKTSHRDIEAN